MSEREIDWSRRKLWTAEHIRVARREIELGDWGTPIERETRRRIRAAVAAYAYEIAGHEIMLDAEFDKLVQAIQPRMGTCHPLVDEFFVTRFSPMTGMWIHDHPELPKIRDLHQRHYGRAR